MVISHVQYAKIYLTSMTHMTSFDSKLTTDFFFPIK